MVVRPSPDPLLTQFAFGNSLWTYAGRCRGASATGPMYVTPLSLTLVGMTRDNASKRGWWVGAAVAVFAAGIVARTLIRSGAVAEGLLSHWYGHVGLTVAALLAAGTVLYLLHRAYRRR